MAVPYLLFLIHIYCRI